MVEFAIVAPLLMLVMLGGLDVTINTWRKLMANHAVYTGTQLATQQDSTDDTAVKTQITTLAPFITNANISIDRNVTLVASADAVAISAKYQGLWIASLTGFAWPDMTSATTLLKEERPL